MDIDVLDISEHEWQKAREIQQELLTATDEASRQAVLARHSGSGIVLGQLGSNYLPRFREMPISEGNKAVGISGLNHNFVAINDEMYVIRNVDESTLLGQGKFGQVFMGQNEQGQECAIKVEPVIKHSANEVNALKKMGYLQNSAEIDGKFYTIMDRFPGRGLMHMSTKGKVADPWQAAAKELGFSLKNLAQVKRDFDYDSFEDDDYYSSICKKMSQDSAPFTLDNLQQLKNRVAELVEVNNYSKTERLNFVIAAGEQMKHAFDGGILHRDIKGDNFVGQLNDNGSVSVAMVDFGGAITLDDAKLAKNSFGSPLYMAPEVLKSLPEAYRKKLPKYLYDKLTPTPEPPVYSCASDIYSFAVMCKDDFGMDPNSGFGVLQLAKSDNPDERPSIEEVIACFRAELACHCQNSDIELQSVNGIRQLQSLSSVSEDSKTAALSTLSTFVNRELDRIHDDFSQQYKELTRSSSPSSLGFFASTPTNVANMSMTEILKKSTKPFKIGHRKRDLLIKNGWLDSNNQQTGELKSLLECQTELEVQRPNTPTFKQD